MVNNPFAPLTKSETRYQNERFDHDDSKPIVPVPDDVAKEPPMHLTLGKPLSFWEYKNQLEQTLFLVCRFIDKDKKKQDRPLSYRKYKDGTSCWAWKGLDTPRPLYGLDRLANAPDAPVIVCEGEKAADAATALFPDYVAVTSPNGAGSAHFADWSAPEGRTVIIWPDNDAEGLAYAQKSGGLIKKAGAQSVSIVAVPEGFTDKWDLADPLPEGLGMDELTRLVKDANPVLDPLENLIERVHQDIGTAFMPEVMDSLSDLRKENLPEFMRMRDALKKAGAGVTHLDTALTQRAIELGEISPEPDHLEHAHEVIEKLGRDNILATATHIWQWLDNGVWNAISERALKQEVQKVLEQKNHKVFRSIVDSVADVLKTEIYAPEHEWNPKQDAVTVANGELHWNGKTWEMQPHCRNNFRTSLIPVAYDPHADCPLFKKFLGEIFEGDPDAQDKARVISELIGYSMVSHARFERFSLLVGSGANGKSVIMEVIRALVGRDNVSAVQPSQFGNKFQRAHLHLKLANLVTEIAEGGEIADAELKAITSGELTTAEHKGKDPFDFTPFCTCWFGTNHMPHTRDFSDALFRRALVIPFNNKFEGTKADPNLKTKLLDELPGIMNIALQAFGEVLERGTFTEPQSCLDAKAEWRKEADQAAQFVEEKCVLIPNCEITSAALYEEYRQWADEVGISRKLNRKNFTLRLFRLGCKPGKTTAGKRMIKGIRIGWEA